MEHSHRCFCKARGISWFDFSKRHFQPGFSLFLGCVYALDLSSDGLIVIGGSEAVVIAHHTTAYTVLWRKEMHGELEALRIHGGVVVVVIGNNNTVVLDRNTGHQLHAFPLFEKYVRGICVFDGLTSGLI
jgi:hypothetical protein